MYNVFLTKMSAYLPAPKNTSTPSGLHRVYDPAAGYLMENYRNCNENPVMETEY